METVIMSLVAGVFVALAFAIGVKGKLSLIAGWSDEAEQQLADRKAFARWVGANIALVGGLLLLAGFFFAPQRALWFFGLLTGVALWVPVAIYLGLQKYKKMGE